MLLTTAPLGGVFVAGAPPSHCDRDELDGGLIAHHPDVYAKFAGGWARRRAAQLRSIA